MGELVGLFGIGNDKGVKVAAAPDLEFRLVVTLADLDELGVCSAGLLQKVTNIGNLLRHVVCLANYCWSIPIQVRFQGNRWTRKDGRRGQKERERQGKCGKVVRGAESKQKQEIRQPTVWPSLANVLLLRQRRSSIHSSSSTRNLGGQDTLVSAVSMPKRQHHNRHRSVPHGPTDRPTAQPHTHTHTFVVGVDGSASDVVLVLVSTAPCLVAPSRVVSSRAVLDYQHLYRLLGVGDTARRSKREMKA